MGLVADVSAFDRVVVNVLQFLMQHRFPINQLWVAAFLPKLMVAVAFVSSAAVRELFEQCIYVSFLEVVDYLSRSVRLEVADFLRQVICRGDEVGVILEDHET